MAERVSHDGRCIEINTGRSPWECACDPALRVSRARATALEAECAGLRVEAGRSERKAGEQARKHEGAAKLRNQYQAENAELRSTVAALVEALVPLGPPRQFRTPCFCTTADGCYCVGQPQCNRAGAALASHSAAASAWRERVRAEAFEEAAKYLERWADVTEKGQPGDMAIDTVMDLADELRTLAAPRPEPGK